MKLYNVLLFISLLILGLSSAFAQTEHVINFLDIQHANLRHTFGHNEKARVRIDNINRFIYNVNEEKTEEDFNTQIPAILSSIKLPSFLTSQLPVSGSPSTNKAVNTGQSVGVLQSDFNDKLADLIRTWRAINVAIDTHNDIVHKSKNCEKSFSNIETEVKTSLAPFVGGQTSESITSLANKMENLLSGKIQLSNNIVNDMEELLNAWKSRALTIYRNGQITDDDQLATLNTELQDLQKKKPVIESSITAKKKQIRDLERRIKQQAIDFETAVAGNDAILSKAKSLLADINKLKEDGKYFKLVDDIRKVNPSNYTYYTETVVMKKDEYRFKINAVSEERMACDKAAEQKIEVVLRTNGGVKLDFSTGVFTMVGSEDFLGRSYYYKPISATESSIAAADNGKRALLGIGALMHIYKRSPAKLKVGGALGVSSTFDFDALNFHIGPTFIIGDRDRFCITVGITAREVDILDNKYILDHVYNIEDLPEDIPTYNMFPKWGGFFSFTYNISRFNK